MSLRLPDPSQRPMTCSPSGSMRRNVGQPSSGYFSTTALFESNSVSMESQIAERCSERTGLLSVAGG